MEKMMILRSRSTTLFMLITFLSPLEHALCGDRFVGWKDVYEGGRVGHASYCADSGGNVTNKIVNGISSADGINAIDQINGVIRYYDSSCKVIWSKEYPKEGESFLVPSKDFKTLLWIYYGKMLDANYPRKYVDGWYCVLDENGSEIIQKSSVTYIEPLVHNVLTQFDRERERVQSGRPTIGTPFMLTKNGKYAYLVVGDHKEFANRFIFLNILKGKTHVYDFEQYDTRQYNLSDPNFPGIPYTTEDGVCVVVDASWLYYGTPCNPTVKYAYDIENDNRIDMSRYPQFDIPPECGSTEGD